MLRDISIDEFIELVISRKIRTDEKVKISSDDLLTLLKEELELKKQLEELSLQVKASDTEKDLEIRRLNFLLDNEKKMVKRLQEKVIDVMEMEKLQRHRAIQLQEKLQRNIYQDTTFSYTVRR